MRTHTNRYWDHLIVPVSKSLFDRLINLLILGCSIREFFIFSREPTGPRSLVIARGLRSSGLGQELASLSSRRQSAARSGAGAGVGMLRGAGNSLT